MLTAFDTREALVAAAAARIANVLSAAIEDRGEACAALSGGSAEHVYRALAAMTLDWPKITFALVDERFAPPTDPVSNQYMIERALAPAFAAGARFAPIYGDGDIGAAAARADALYRPLRIDVAIMGMGEDGHTASWFDGARGFDQALDPASERIVVALHATQAQGRTERLSLTRAALSRAGLLLLIITGGAKRARLEAALANEGAPVAALYAPGMAPIETMWAP
jgi:6-phosphogluconolactonase